VSYASFRTDKPASPGYSAELISDNIDPKFYDDLMAQPSPLDKDLDTLFKVYKNNVKNHSNMSFLGTRYPTGEKDAKGDAVFGEYKW